MSRILVYVAIPLTMIRVLWWHHLLSFLLRSCVRSGKRERTTNARRKLGKFESQQISLKHRLMTVIVRIERW